MDIHSIDINELLAELSRRVHSYQSQESTFQLKTKNIKHEYDVDLTNLRSEIARLQAVILSKDSELLTLQSDYDILQEKYYNLWTQYTNLNRVLRTLRA